MKKSILTESIRGYLIKSEPTDDNIKNFHYKRVEVAVASAFEELMKTLVKEDEGLIEASYVKSYYDQPVTTNGNQQYVELVDSIVSLPNGRGVFYCKPSGESKLYAQSNVNTTSLFGSLPMGEAVNDTWFRIGNPNNAGLSIIFQHVGDSYRRSVKSVDYGVVRDFASYDDDEEIHVPSNAYSFIIEKVMAWFGVRYTDLANNGK